MATIGKVQVAEITPEIIGQEALAYLEAELHLTRNVARDFEYVDTKVGETVKVPKRGTLTANAKVGNTAVTVQNPSMDTVPVVLDQHWEVTFQLEDIARTLAQGGYEIDLGYISDAIQVLSEKVESSLAALAADMGTTLGTAGTDITAGLIRTCRSTLTTARAPRTNRFLYLEPDQLNVLLAEAAFTDVSKYGSGMPVQEGEFGRIYGFRVFESIFTVSDGSPVAVHNLAMHRNAMVLATRPMARPKSPGVQVAYVEKDGIMLRVLFSYNGSLLADQITIDTLFGVAPLREELGINLLS